MHSIIVDFYYSCLRFVTFSSHHLKSLFKKCVYVTAQLSIIYLVCLPVLSICVYCCLGSRSILNSELCGYLYRLETVSPADA